MFGSQAQALKQACAIAIVSVGIISGAIGAAQPASAALPIDRHDIVSAAQTPEERAAAREAWRTFREAVQAARMEYHATMAQLRAELRNGLAAARTLPRADRAAAIESARSAFDAQAQAAAASMNAAIQTAANVLLGIDPDPQPEPDPQS